MLVILAAAQGCTDSLQCGPGTHLLGSQCLPDATDAGTGDLASTSDLATPAGCAACTTSCCLTDGTCADNNAADKSCGNPGQLCESCTTKAGGGWFCQTGAVIGYRCVQPQANGTTCTDNGDCGSQYCNASHVCATQCTGTGSSCVTGNAVCCDSNATCQSSPTAGNQVVCCLGTGKETTQSFECCSGANWNAAKSLWTCK